MRFVKYSCISKLGYCVVLLQVLDNNSNKHQHTNQHKNVVLTVANV